MAGAAPFAFTVRFGVCTWRRALCFPSGVLGTQLLVFAQDPLHTHLLFSHIPSTLLPCTLTCSIHTDACTCAFLCAGSHLR